MSTKSAKSSTASKAVRDVIEGDTVTLMSTVMKNGKEVREPVTFQVPKLEDLPRTIRRRIRQAQVKYAAPSQNDRSGGRFDLFTLAFEVGEMVAQYYGVSIDLDDESLPVEEADAQDAVITSLGIRVLSTQKMDGGAPNAPGGEVEATES